MLWVVLEMAAGELERLYKRISGRFARAEPRARVRRYVSGLVAGLERKNGWTLAEPGRSRRQLGAHAYAPADALAPAALTPVG